MRTATPISTWSWIRLTARSSATSESISTPRFIGPGCITRTPGAAQRQLLAVEAEEAEVLAGRGDQRARASAPAAGAASSPRRRRRCPSRMSWNTSTPQRSAPTGISVGGPTRRTRAPSMLQQWRRWSGPRGCAARRRRSPPSAPRRRPNARRMESASSSAWVGCSCWPSPALITLQVTFCDEQRGRAGRAVAHHQEVRLHGVQRHRGVDQRLALGDRRGARAHVDHVGAQPLAGQLEASSGCAWSSRRTGSSACDPSSRSSFFAFCRFSATKPSARSSRSCTCSRSRSATESEMARGKRKGPLRGPHRGQARSWSLKRRSRRLLGLSQAQSRRAPFVLPACEAQVAVAALASRGCSITSSGAKRPTAWKSCGARRRR